MGDDAAVDVVEAPALFQLLLLYRTAKPPLVPRLVGYLLFDILWPSYSRRRTGIDCRSRVMSLPPAHTWPSFLACAGFQALVYLLCFHRRGAEIAKRGPTLLGWWLKRNSRDGAGAGGAEPARIKIAPPTSVAQSWRLGALHERFSKGSCAGEESTLREAGEVLGRSLTEVRTVHTWYILAVPTAADPPCRLYHLWGYIQTAVAVPVVV